MNIFEKFVLAFLLRRHKFSSLARRRTLIRRNNSISGNSGTEGTFPGPRVTILATRHPCSDSRTVSNCPEMAFPIEWGHDVRGHHHHRAWQTRREALHPRVAHHRL